MATEKELRQKVVGIMQSWVGRKEIDNSYWPIIEIYNNYAKGKGLYIMTKTDAWCACTVSAAFIQAGLTDIGFVEVSCPRMITNAQKAGRWIENDAYVPSSGDIIMYDWQDTGVGDNTGTADHVGIVESINGNTFVVIEGNISDSVGRRTMQVNGKYIRGFIVPNYAAKASSGSTTNNATNTNTSTNTGSTSSATNTEELIWNILYAEIKNAYGVAGMMGNLYAESGLFANNLQNVFNTKFGLTDAQYTQKVDNGSYTNFVKDSAGYGLAQWTYYTRKQNLLNYAKSKGKSIGDTQMQAEFLVQELKTDYKSVLNTLKNATSVRAASDIVLTQFERPAIQTEAVKVARANFGMTYYNKYKNNTNGAITGGSTSTGSVNTNTTLVKGDKVKVLNAVTYTGGKFVVYYDKYDVLEVKGDRVVIGIGKVTTAVVNASNLQKV